MFGEQATTNLSHVPKLQSGEWLSDKKNYKYDNLLFLFKNIYVHSLPQEQKCLSRGLTTNKITIIYRSILQMLKMIK